MKRGLRIMLAGALCLSFFLAACQPTPEKEAVVNKADSYEKIVQSGESGVEDSAVPAPYEAPAHWADHIEDGKLTIDVDTDVELPVTTGFPVAILERERFTQEQVDKMVEYFAHGRRLYRLPRIETKEEIMDQIVEAKQARQNSVEHPENSESTESIDQWIKELEERYENAPEEDPTEYVDATLTDQMDYLGNVETEGGKNYLYVGIEGEGVDTYGSGEEFEESISVGNANPYNPRTWFSYDAGGIFYTETFYRNNIDAPDIDAQTDPTFRDWENQIKNTDMTEDQAIEACEKILADFGIGNLKLGSIEGAAFLDGNNYPVKGGYYVTYEQEMNGVMGFGRDQWGKSLARGEELPAYAPPFDQEELEIYINEDGVHYLYWNSPAKVVETVNDNAQLAPFDTVQQAVLDQIRYKQSFLTQEDHFTGVRAEILSAQLYLSYIGVKDNLDQAMMVPVWVFPVRQYPREEGGEEHPGNTESYGINALDGSVVDLSPQDWAMTAMK